MNEEYEEGVKAIVREGKKARQTPAKVEKIVIDKKKLVIYSELMKPKFDEDLF